MPLCLSLSFASSLAALISAHSTPHPSAAGLRIRLISAKRDVVIDIGNGVGF
jgi:hypothetical protein